MTAITAIPLMKPRNKALVGIALAAGVVGGLGLAEALIAHDQKSAAPSVAMASGWADTPAGALINLQSAYQARPMAWSPTVHEPDIGDYHAMWFNNGQIRAYVDAGDAVTALSISEDNPADLAAARREAARFVLAATPKVPEPQRTQISETIANLVEDGQKGTAVQLGGVEFKVSAGALHYSIRAKPIS